MPLTLKSTGKLNKLKGMIMNPKRKLTRLSGLLLASACLSSPTLLAQTSWNVSGGGLFSDGANWTAGAPSTGVVTQFNNSATGTITLNADTTSGQLSFANTSGALNFDFGSHTLTASSNISVTTASTTNNITFSSGTVIYTGTTAINLGINAATSLTVTGPNTVLQGTGQLQANHNGTGTSKSITVSNGASLSFLAGGGADSRVGNDVTITVTGAGSTFSHAPADFRFGFGGNDAQMNVLAGGTLSAVSLRVGDSSANTNNNVLISGEDSLLAISNNLRFRSSDSDVIVSDGGRLTVGSEILIGETNNSSNMNLIVTGSGSSAQSGRVRIGAASSINPSGSTLQVLDGATYQVTNIEMGFNTSSLDNRVIVGTDAILTSTGATGISMITDATLRLDGGTVTTSNAGARIYMHPGAQVVGSGTINSIILQDGTGSGRLVAPGLDGGFGVITVNGAFQNAGIDITTKLGDFSSNLFVPGTNYDQLLVSGTFTSGGSLLIDVDDYVGGTDALNIRVLGWDTFSGDISNLNVSFSDINTPLTWSFEADGIYVMSVIPEPATWALLMGAGVLAIGILRRRLRG